MKKIKMLKIEKIKSKKKIPYLIKIKIKKLWKMSLKNKMTMKTDISFIIFIKNIFYKN